MLALHLPSKQEAEVLGYHQGRKAHLVKLRNGNQQYWTKNNVIIIGDKEMTTDRILLTVSGEKGKTWHSVDRIFSSVDEAAIYISELTRLYPIRDYDKTYTVAEMSNGWTIMANYNIKEILKKVAPRKDLWDWYPFDMQKKLASTQIKSLASNHHSIIDDPQVKPPQKKLPLGEVVRLQDLTKDPRKARSVLRDLVRQKKIEKPGRWEWPVGSADLEVVKKALLKSS